MKTYEYKINHTLNSTFGKGIREIAEMVKGINPLIKVVASDTDVQKVITLRKKVYADCYPQSAVNKLDEYDQNSIILFSESPSGNAISTCRLVIDTQLGFLEEDTYHPFINKYRQDGCAILECGRCIVTSQSKVRAVNYLQFIKELAKLIGIDYVVMFNREVDVPKIISRIESTQVLTTTDKTFGGKHKFTAMLWSLKQDQENIYNPHLWSDYARSFMTITTSFQSEMLQEAAQYLSGHVVDCGAGCAKIAPYLKYQESVRSYTAIDACAQMCKLGNKVLAKVNTPNFKITHSYIEDFKGLSLYDSAVSINSLYTWDKPHEVLFKIHSLLKDGGIFILANVNTSLDIRKLSQQVEADLLMHPDARYFHTYNLEIADNTLAHRYDLKTLLQMVKQAGFTLLTHHEQFYDGGLSFLVLKKLKK